MSDEITNLKEPKAAMTLKCEKCGKAIRPLVNGIKTNSEYKRKTGAKQVLCVDHFVEKLRRRQ